MIFEYTATLGLKPPSWVGKLALDLMWSLASWPLTLQWSESQEALHVAEWCGLTLLFCWLITQPHTPISMPHFPQCVHLCGWVRTGCDIGDKWMEWDFFTCSLSLRWDILPDVLYMYCSNSVSKDKQQSYFYPQVKANVMAINIVACHLCSRNQKK